MLDTIKKSAGKLKRGVQGVIQSMENVPHISPSLTCFPIGKACTGAEITALTIGSGETKVCLVFAIHGNEIGTVKLAHHLIDYVKMHSKEFDDLTIHIVPSLNVDGYTSARKFPDYLNGGRIGRFNSNNVDLNRNFPVRSFLSSSVWSFGKEYSESVEVFCGNEGNSEPETKAITKFIETERVDFVYSFHNSGRDLLAGKTELSQRIMNMYAKETGYKILPEEEWLNLRQTGTFKEWCDERSISFLEVEGATRWGSDWKRQKNALIESLGYLNRSIR